ncbi:MAG TPA: hypothetical protein VFK14_12385 [Solirubrobacterales bacterium]|nr:hypothetical protein [Solirubrobacterales bacterium]
MNRAGQNWFRLGFPRELTSDACLAALASFSGAAHASKLVFELTADQQGITHRLGVNSEAADMVVAALRAAIPSLRLDEIDAPAAEFRLRLLWQLAPARAALRTDDLAAISADLLSSLFPLAEGEAIRWRWFVRPELHPKLESNERQDGQLRALAHKLAAPGVSAYGELAVTARHHGRARELIKRVAAPLWSLRTPHGRLALDTPVLGRFLHLLGLRGRFFSVDELAAVIGWPIDEPDLPGLELGAAKRLVPSSSLPETGRVVGVSDFAGLNRQVAISPAASTKGLYVLGPTGTGKTSLLKNLILSDLKAGHGLAVVETNGDLIQDLLGLIPPERAGDVVLLDPTDKEFAVGFNPFVGSPDPSLVADQLGELFQRLWHQFWGPRTGQLAHMGLLTLAQTNGATLIDLPRLFLDPALRSRVLSRLDDPVGLEPDWRWFLSLSKREQATVIAPLLNKVRQFTARASIRAIIGQASPATSMHSIMADQKILLAHLPKGLIGSETAQLLGCLVLTALWQAAAERTALPPSARHPFGLYVDEVQDFAAAPIPWEEMFAQGRKYGLALSVAHQNLEQLPRELREVVLANARSKAVFALSPTDARHLEPLFAPALTAADLMALDAYSVAAIVALDDGSTSRPVTLRTPSPPAPLIDPATVRQASRQGYAKPSSEVEAELRRRATSTPTSPVGRKPRSMQ